LRRGEIRFGLLYTARRVDLRLVGLQLCLMQLLSQDGDLILCGFGSRLGLGEGCPCLVLARAHLFIVEHGNHVAGFDAVALPHADLDHTSAGLRRDRGVVPLDATADGHDILWR
jgi:hypothetical protein